MNTMANAKRLVISIIALSILLGHVICLFTGCLIPMKEFEYLLLAENRVLNFSNANAASVAADGTVYIAGSSDGYAFTDKIYKWTVENGLEFLVETDDYVKEIAVCDTGAFFAINDKLYICSDGNTVNLVDSFGDPIDGICALKSHLLVWVNDWSSADFYLYPKAGGSYTDTYVHGDQIRSLVYSSSLQRAFFLTDASNNALVHLDIDEATGTFGGTGSYNVLDHTWGSALVLSEDARILVHEGYDMFDIFHGAPEYIGYVGRMPAIITNEYAVAWDYDYLVGIAGNLDGQPWYDIYSFEGDLVEIAHRGNAIHLILSTWEDELYIWKIPDGDILKGIENGDQLW